MADIETIKFDLKHVEELKTMKYGRNWPVVYIIKSDTEAYIGETSDAYNRTKQHLVNQSRKNLEDISLISDAQFNKSAILDIESALIRYIAADGKYTLQNISLGQSQDHLYYQKDLYLTMFNDIWRILQQKGIATNDLDVIKNSDLFKFSPYKCLTEDQYLTVYSIFQKLVNYHRNKTESTFIVNGGAGTGKTVLAIYLISLIANMKKSNLEMTDLDDLIDKDLYEEGYLDNLLYLRNISEMKIALVIPMASLRTTLKNVFKKIHGLSSAMVIGPSEVTKMHYDLLIVDEAHRLRRKVNISGFQHKNFQTKNQMMNLPEDATELDWIKKCSTYQILFYDKTQSIKPTDVRREDFLDLTLRGNVDYFELSSQLRVLGGNDYLNYLKELLSGIAPEKTIQFNNYDFKIFDDVEAMVSEIKKKDKIYGLCRNVAGYAWPWKTKNKSLNDIFENNLYDINIANYHYVWNTEGNDWVNSKNAINEIGCIHTIQGYDLNYAGVIIGHEITYDYSLRKIVIDSKNYYDSNGSRSIKSDVELQDYITNIYRVLLSRGIKGTYVYVCDDNLRSYFKKYIEAFEN